MSSQATGSAGFYEFLGWLEENKKRLAIAFVVAVVVGFAVAAYRYKSHQTELAAADALLELRTPMAAPGEKPTPRPSSDFLKVANDYPGTLAAERARLLAAGALFAEGKYSEAEAQFGNFLSAHVNHPMAANAAYGKAACLETEGKLDDALKAYQDLVAQYPKSAVQDETKLSIARIYELKNQPQSALKIYDELAKPGPSGSANSEVLKRKEFILSKFPDLAKTIAPTTATNLPATTGKTNPSAVSTNTAAAKTNSAPAKP